MSKIEYVLGDLFKSDAPIMVHGCNSQGVMGSGVAKYVREYYPEAYTDYRHVYEDRGLRTGESIYVHTMNKFHPYHELVIVNAITQNNFGRTGEVFVDYDAIKQVFEDLNELTQDMTEHVSGLPKVAMPRIGAGLGGGDWDIIAQIIEDVSMNYIPIVYIPEWEKAIYADLIP